MFMLRQSGVQLYISKVLLRRSLHNEMKHSSVFQSEVDWEANVLQN